MFKQPGSVLVTGGAGYIGSHLVGLLLNHGYGVRVLDNLTFGGRGLLSYLTHAQFEFQHGDLRKEEDVHAAISGIDSIVHLAAIVGDPACRKEPDLAREVNQTASEMLCSTAIQSGVKRFVFASTCSNYGRMDTNDSFVDETSPLRPVSLYAELKVGFEEYLLKAHSADFTPTVLRFATAYGLSPRPRFDLTVNEFTRELTLSRRLEVYGRQFWRPYAHARDLAAACVTVLETETEKVAGQAFNIGANDENYQKESLVAMIVRELDAGGDNVVYVQRDEDPRNYRVNFDKVRRLSGFELSRSVSDGIREIIGAIRSGIIVDPDSRLYRNA